MIYGVYAYRDNKTFFGQIWNDYNDESAKRGFSVMMSNNDNIMGFSPADFDLFKIAEYDSENGQITPVWPIMYLMSGNAAFQRSVIEDEKQSSEGI